MMAWYWQMVMALVTLNVAFVMAALLRSVIRDRIERGASEGTEERYLAQELVLHFLECPWPAFAPRREAGDQRLTST
jgi:hypothetical protein